MLAVVNGLAFWLAGRALAPFATIAEGLERIQRGELHAVTAASSEALVNLLDLAGTQAAPQLLELPLFVPHEAIGAAAARLGFRRIRVTSTSDAGLLEGMMAFFAAPA